MQRKLINLALVAVFGCSILPVSNRAFAAAPPQAGVPPTPGGQTPMTNADVVRMLQAITTRIRSGPVRFDLSPMGLAALRQAGVSEEMLRAMEQAEKQAQATPPTGGSTGSTPAGMVPPGKSAKPGAQSHNSTLAVKVRNTPPQLGPAVTNPAATQPNAALIGLLRQQKQTTLNRSGQNTPPSGHPPSPILARASEARTAFPISAPPPSSGNSLSNRASLSSRENVIAACGTFNSPIIQSVSGQSGGTAVFTQDPAYNPYIIEGCNFGSAPGHAQLNFQDGKKLGNLKVYSWSDNAITVEVDPALVDVLDQSNITLVLFPAVGKQAERSGFKFYALRREILLNNIPAGQVYLAPIKDDAGNLVLPHYASPFSGASAEVQRSNVVRFPGGTDQFNFDKLKPGFVVEKYQVSKGSDSIGCESPGIEVPDETDYTDGAWNWESSGNAIRITWQEKHVHCTGAVGETADGSLASYGLHVWLVGPALSPGASPWQ